MLVITCNLLRLIIEKLQHLIVIYNITVGIQRKYLTANHIFMVRHN